RILNTPRRGIGDRAEACVAVHAETNGIGFGEALADAAAGKVAMLNSRSEKAIAAFMDMLDQIRVPLRTDDPGALPDIGDVVEAVLNHTGYRYELENSSDPQELARLDNLNELVSVAHEFSADAANAQAAGEDVPGDDEDVGAPPGSLEAFLERVSLVADADELPES
ncbi:ATP-dependent DNA helicase PcrA, partial [Staphylococcus capitis]|nr:ATP-dependent DNA helicase PcrA [Staphylococcus capitis]